MLCKMAIWQTLVVRKVLQSRGTNGGERNAAVLGRTYVCRGDRLNRGSAPNNTAGMVCFLNSWGTTWIKGPRAVQGRSDLPQGNPKDPFGASGRRSLLETTTYAES